MVEAYNYENFKYFDKSFTGRGRSIFIKTSAASKKHDNHPEAQDKNETLFRRDVDAIITCIKQTFDACNIEILVANINDLSSDKLPIFYADNEFITLAQDHYVQIGLTVKSGMLLIGIATTENNSANALSYDFQHSLDLLESGLTEKMSAANLKVSKYLNRPSAFSKTEILQTDGDYLEQSMGR